MLAGSGIRLGQPRGSRSRTRASHLSSSDRLVSNGNISVSASGGEIRWERDQVNRGPRDGLKVREGLPAPLKRARVSLIRAASPSERRRRFRGFDVLIF